MKTVHINHEDYSISVANGSGEIVFQDQPDGLYLMSNPILRPDGHIEFTVFITNIDAEIHSGLGLDNER